MSKMGRQKGGRGEREVVKLLTKWYNDIRLEKATPTLTLKDSPFQRNQLQTAIGGSDITNPFGLEVEVKRQEKLSVNTWWEQVNKASDKSRGIPILMYRQNNGSWKIMMWGSVQCSQERIPVKITLKLFEDWFKGYLREEWWRVDG
jgi:hypothetical protein